MKLRNKKTGEVIDLNIANIKAQFGTISVIPEPAKLGGDEYVYYSLAELNDEWEDCEPKKPLIKDERIRKAVQAWAEACCIELIEITHSRECILRAMDAITNNDEICINREIGQILDEKVYNITELCGEEEE